MPMIHCEKCGAITSGEYSYCTNCQAPILKKVDRSESQDAITRTSEVPIDAKTSPSETLRTPRDGLAKWLFTPVADNVPGENAVREAKKKVCLSCGAAVAPRLKFCSNCGRALTIDVAEVLNSTFRIIRKQPVILLPILLEQVVNGLLLAWIYLPLLAQLNSTPASSLRLALLWASIAQLLLLFIAWGVTVVPLVHGMYPIMVKETIHGERVDLPRAFNNSLRKFPSLSVSYILVIGAVFLGFLALFVPGVILTIWYYYTVPAITLEGRGARDGMSASKAFARDKKWETLAMLLVSLTPSFVGSVLVRIVPVFVWNGIPYLTINLFFGVLSGVLSAVMTSYAYLAYAIPKERTAVV